MGKKVKLKLLGLDGKALMGAFKRQARLKGWTEGEINRVLADATASDTAYLVSVLAEHCYDGED